MMFRSSSPQIDRRFRLARIWSNQQLKQIAPFFNGDIANVSAGEDVDKQGARYRDYFPHADTYWLTNYAPGKYRGYEGRENELLLDLTNPLPSDLHNRFEVVFNHTTLEHVFDVFTAFCTLCSLSKDIVILVVPFCQVQHENAGYKDYWRFTPTCLRRLFTKQGMTIVYEAANDDFNGAVYLFFVASRNPDRWKAKLPSWEPVAEAASWVGREPVAWKQIAALLWRKIGVSGA